MRTIDPALIPECFAQAERLMEKRRKWENPRKYMTLEELDFWARHSEKQSDAEMFAFWVKERVSPEVWEVMRQNYHF